MAITYIGTVDNFITPSNLISLCGLTVGVANDDAKSNYLKFYDDINGNNVLFPANHVANSLMWSNLNNANLVQGKTITINGVDYLIRLPRGGNGTDTDFTGGGREWNEYLVNNSSKFPPIDFATKRNHCLERSSGGLTVCRGGTSLDYYISINSPSSSSIYAWTPMLIQLTYEPEISIKDENLGELLSPIEKTYTVTSRHGNNFDLVVKLNGEIIKNLKNQNSGTTYDLELSLNWDKALLLDNKIKIYATDNVNGMVSDISTITFTKIKPPITTIPTESTLTQAVNHMIELNKEIDYQELKLSSNLVAKGVEVLKTDKMSNLIDKVEELSSIKIKSGESLPSVVEEGVLFIKTTTPINKINIQDVQPSLSEGDVYIKSSSDNSQGALQLYTIGNSSKRVKIYVSSVQQIDNGILTTKSAWIGQNGQWVQFSFEEYIIFSADICNLGSDVSSNWVYYCYSQSSRTSTSLSLRTTPKRIYTTTSSGEYADDDCYWYINTTLDFTPFKKLYFELSSISVRSYGSAGVGVWDIANKKAVVSKSYGWSSYPNSDFVELDVSNVNGPYTIYIMTSTGSANSGATIEAPKFYLTS